MLSGLQQAGADNAAGAFPQVSCASSTEAKRYNAILEKAMLMPAKTSMAQRSPDESENATVGKKLASLDSLKVTLIPGDPGKTIAEQFKETYNKELNFSNLSEVTKTEAARMRTKQVAALNRVLDSTGTNEFGFNKNVRSGITQKPLQKANSTIQKGSLSVQNAVLIAGILKCDLQQVRDVFRVGESKEGKEGFAAFMHEKIQYPWCINQVLSDMNVYLRAKNKSLISEKTVNNGDSDTRINAIKSNADRVEAFLVISGMVDVKNKTTLLDDPDILKEFIKTFDIKPNILLSALKSLSIDLQNEQAILVLLQNLDSTLVLENGVDLKKNPQHLAEFLVKSGIVDVENKTTLLDDASMLKGLITKYGLNIKTLIDALDELSISPVDFKNENALFILSGVIDLNSNELLLKTADEFQKYCEETNSDSSEIQKKLSDLGLLTPELKAEIVALSPKIGFDGDVVMEDVRP